MSKQEALQHGDIVRYVGPLLAPWMESDLLVSDTDGHYIRVVHNENFTWVPVQDVVCMEEAEEAEEEEAEEEETEEADEEEEAEEEETEEEEEAEEEEEEEEVFEIEIKGKSYYTTDEQNGKIYKIEEDEDVGPVIGNFVNGVAKFS